MSESNDGNVSSNLEVLTVDQRLLRFWLRSDDAKAVGSQSTYREAIVILLMYAI